MSQDDRDDDELDREAILARRRRFIAAALSGIVLSQAACATPQPCLEPVPPTKDASTDTGTPQPCLSPVWDAGPDNGPPPPDAGPDAGPQPCLTPLPPDAGPQPCLSDVFVPRDTGPGDAGIVALDRPQVCLSIALDAGPQDTGTPMPCLSPPPPPPPPADASLAEDTGLPEPCLRFAPDSGS